MEHSRSLLFIVLSCIIYVGALAKTYDVSEYGAVGNGQADDTKAFLGAWDDACADTSKSATFLVPNGKTFLVDRVNFTGPCNSTVNFQVEGNIQRPTQNWGEDVDFWIIFTKISGLRIYGSGQFDGQGQVYWPCKRDRTCQRAPHTLGFVRNSQVVFTGLRFVNSPQMHVMVWNSSNVVITNLNITAPGDSPNTDGIHIQGCTNVQIKNCTIGTGDDCISVGKGTTNLYISQITCGPGHGISIGSLGKGNAEAQVQHVYVRDSRISGTTNGLRIKTWQGGSGYAKGIYFQNISLTAVQNPIIIDQFYCDHEICTAQPSAVKVSDVHYIGITGTSASDVAINFNCSQSVPCDGIVMDGVNLQLAPVQGAGEVALLPGNKEEGGGVPPDTSYCHDARGTKMGVVVPDVPCLTTATPAQN